MQNSDVLVCFNYSLRNLRSRVASHVPEHEHCKFATSTCFSLHYYTVLMIYPLITQSRSTFHLIKTTMK